MGLPFFRVSLNPKSPPKWKPPPLPPGAHYSAARHPPAPPPRARGQGTSPLNPTPPGSPIKIINHFLLGSASRTLLASSKKPLTTLTPKKEGQTYNLSSG